MSGPSCTTGLRSWTHAKAGPPRQSRGRGDRPQAPDPRADCPRTSRAPEPPGWRLLSTRISTSTQLRLTDVSEHLDIAGPHGMRVTPAARPRRSPGSERMRRGQSPAHAGRGGAKRRSRGGRRPGGPSTRQTQSRRVTRSCTAGPGARRNGNRCPRRRSRASLRSRFTHKTGQRRDRPACPPVGGRVNRAASARWKIMLP